MTAQIVEMQLREGAHQGGCMFHCPLTGTPIVGELDQAFEAFASPYFLFCITPEGIVLSRKDDLPEPSGAGLKRVVDTLIDAGRPSPDNISSHELHTFVPNVLADLLPDSTVIFDIATTGDHDSPAARLWVAMDFTLPAKPVDESVIDHSAELIPVE